MIVEAQPLAGTALSQPVSEDVENNPVRPGILKWLVILIIITTPYQLLYLPGLEGGYYVDLVILIFMAIGWLYILWQRLPLRLPLLLPHALILIASLVATTTTGLDRTEAITTLIFDVYVWVMFYTLFNLVRYRQFLYTMITVWVVMAVIESVLIVVSGMVTGDESINRVGLGDTQTLQAIDAPSLANLPSEPKQAAHVVKRLQIQSYGLFAPVPKGTFANGDFTSNYLAMSFFLVLAIPDKRWLAWLLKIPACILIFYACYTTGVSSPLLAFPAVFGLYIFLLSSPTARLFWITIGAVLVAGGLFAYAAAPSLTGVDLFTLLGQSSQDPTGMDTGVSGIGSGIEDRLGLITGAWHEFVNHHPFGLSPHGLRSSGLEKNVHNEYVSYLVERGILGLMALLLMHTIISVMALCSMQTDNKVHRFVMAGLFSAYAMAIINDLAHELLRQREMWTLIFLVMVFADLELENLRAHRQAKLAKEWPWAYPDTNYAVIRAE